MLVIISFSCHLFIYHIFFFTSINTNIINSISPIILLLYISSVFSQIFNIFVKLLLFLCVFILLNFFSPNLPYFSVFTFYLPSFSLCYVFTFFFLLILFTNIGLIDSSYVYHLKC